VILRRTSFVDMEPEADSGLQHSEGYDFCPDDHDLDAIVQALDQKRLSYEREGKYEEAEATKQKLEQFQEQSEQKRREDLKARQLSDRLGVEEAHMRELQEFNAHWDNKVAEFESHAASLQTTLRDRHKSEYSKAREKYGMETEPRNPRWSRDLLNLRKIQDTLAKMKKYQEAMKMKQQADQVEAKETESWRMKREAKIRALEDQFLHKQALEMSGLTKRIVSGREEQRQARKVELERLLQRYNNVKSQLESQQKISLWKYDKVFSSRPTSAISHMSVTMSSRHSYIHG